MACLRFYIPEAQYWVEALTGSQTDNTSERDVIRNQKKNEQGKMPVQIEPRDHRGARDRNVHGGMLKRRGSIGEATYDGVAT
jgi:hypothetical protein